MKRIWILIFTVILITSLLFLGISCKEETGETTEQETAAEEVAEETTEQETAAEEVAEEETAEATTEETIEVIYVCPMVGHPGYQVVKEGVDAAAEDNGFTAYFTGADDHTVEKTIEALENAIAQAPDALVVIPFNAPAFTPSLERAKEAGIPVVCAAIDAEDQELRVTYIGTDNVSVGSTAVKAVHGVVGDNMKIGIILSNLDAENQLISLGAVEDYIEDIEGAEIIDIQEDLADMNNAIEVFSAMITAYPEMNALLCFEGTGAPAFGKVLEEQGLIGEITVVSNDDTGDNLATLRDGKIYGLIAQNFRDGWGYDATKYAWQAALGMDVPNIVDSGNVLITQDNIDTYRDEIEIVVIKQ